MEKIYKTSIIVSILLTIMFSCSSVNKNKAILKEESAVKKDIKSDSTKTYKADSTSIIKGYSNHINSNYANDIAIEYEATFDLQGNLIPFYYNNVDDKGNTTSVTISGPGKVINTIKEKVDTETVEEVNELQIKYDKVVNVVKTLQEEIDSYKRAETKDKTVAPDYLKYIIWLGIAGVLLTAIIIGLSIYFKVTLGKYKSLLNTLSNDS